MLTTIIIPCYNVENYIEECVHSAFEQTHPHIEVICIDNNSTDNTWQKLETLKKQYPQLIIDKESKPGAPAARNRGLKHSKGEWLQFLDADDLLLTSKIDHQVKLIQQQDDVCFIAAACFKRDIHGKDNTSIPHPDNPFKSLFATNLGNTCANLWNRKYIETIGGWDETLKSSQEADLMFRLLQVNRKVVFDILPLTVIRERPEGQISTKNPQENWERYFNKRVEILEWLKDNDSSVYETHKEFFDDSLFGILKIISMQKPDGLAAANKLYRTHFIDKYRPSPNQSHSTKPYLLLYKALGFKGAERVRRILGE
jgi:glycosyltransferase involved in cell wall biosynthesis